MVIFCFRLIFFCRPAVLARKWQEYSGRQSQVREQKRRCQKRNHVSGRRYVANYVDGVAYLQRSNGKTFWRERVLEFRKISICWHVKGEKTIIKFKI